jgi:ankyrin repeat protein
VQASAIQGRFSMKKVFLICLVILLSSCELHEQTNLTGVKTKAKVVNLSVIEEISSAIVQNDMNTIARVLANGEFDINVPDKAGELILNKAIKGNKFVIGDFLLRKGAVAETEDDLGQTGVSLAQKGSYPTDWSNLFGNEKLTSETAKTKVFSYLEGASAANENKFLPLIKELMALGAPMDGADSGSFTYLMIASSKNLTGIVKLFCQFPEIDPNVKVERGRGRRKKTFTALILATTDEMRSLLKSCGATE